MSAIHLDPIVPLPVVVIGALALALLTMRVYRAVGATIERWRSAVLLVLRLLGLTLLALLLLQPSTEEDLPPPTQQRTTLIALDTSASMKQRDVERIARLDAARNLLLEANVLTSGGLVENPRLRLFQFSGDAAPLTMSTIGLAAAGPTTRLNKSVQTMLAASGPDEAPNALILLTDGHDFELVNPVKTGSAARARHVPIYAVPFGKQGKVRDVSTRITGFQPYCYVKQKARVAAALRLIGCEFDDLTVQLLRHGQIVQTRRVNAGELQELPVEFEITEPEVGQFEYEIRVQPLQDEVDTANNSAITYLNVIDQQIRVLLLEGDPYWDTTFLQRSLMRNDKFDVDALIRYGQDRVRAIRKTESAGPLKAPADLEQLSRYDVIILGRMVDEVLSPAQAALLEQYVQDRSGTVVFGRGHAFKGPAASALDPVLWGEAGKSGRLRLDPTAEGRALAPFRNLNESAGGLDALPDLVRGSGASETKPLTSTLAVSASRDDGAMTPAIVHRRHGRGQVVSVGVEGLWRWGLNGRTDGLNTPFDRFWDQMVLWLLAGRDFVPTRRFSFRPSSANILLGDKVYFRVRTRQPEPTVKSVPLALYFGDSEISRVNMTAQAGDADRLAGEFVPDRVGRYRAVATFPDGTTQESRFIVFTENLEETEVATDLVGLRRLCESSGGRLIEPGELARLLKELETEKGDATPKVRLCPIWNEAWVFYLAGLLFGLDWFLRRRWGLC